MSSQIAEHYKKYKELYVVGFTFILTGLFGALLTYQLDESARMNVKYEHDLDYAREEGKSALETVNRLISERHMNALNYIYAIDSLAADQISPEEFETARSKYLIAKDNWNYEWNLMRVKIKNYFSDELVLKFYDYEGDKKAEETKTTNPIYWEMMSLTGKFRALHEAIAVAKTTTTPENLELATKIYDSLSYDLYDFYDEMEAMLSSGKLGQMLHRYK